LKHLIHQFLPTPLINRRGGDHPGAVLYVAAEGNCLLPPNLGLTRNILVTGLQQLRNIRSFTQINVTMLRLGICYRKSVCRLSVACNVRAPYSGGWNFRQYFRPFRILAILWPSCKLLRRLSQG